MRCYDENNAATYPLDIYLESASSTTRGISLRYPVRCTGTLRVDGAQTVVGNASFSKNLTVSGTKSRLVETEDYARRLLYSYETPAPMFGDVGEGMIAEDGRCYIWLDPVFAQTVAADRYQVFLQKYGSGDCWVARRGPGCFVVEGTPGLAFGWELKAKQRDFDQRRLDVPIEGAASWETDYGAMAQAHIDKLNSGRTDL